MGGTANDIAGQVEVFARNLHRAKTEVWPTDSERGKIAPAGYVALWVALDATGLFQIPARSPRVMGFVTAPRNSFRWKGEP
jgi:hypothetical protein